MPALENPSGQLAAVVSQLYELAGNSQAPEAQRQALLLQAHDLREDLVNLVAMQFTENSAAYQKVMSNLAGVTDALNQAEAGVRTIAEAVGDVARLAQSVDDLLKTAAQAAANCGKLAG